MAQTADEKIEAALNTVPSQAVVTVQRHEMGADLVEITMVRKDYPLTILKNQVEKIGTYTGVGVWGVDVRRIKDPKGNIAKANFATKNLTDPERGVFRLEPFARAFAGVAKPYTIDSFVVSFEAQRPTEKTLKTFSSKSVALSGRQIPPPFGGLEYRVALFTQDPDRIAIPAEHNPAATAQKPATPPARANDSTLTIVLIAVAALAAGALVYFLTRPRGQGRQPT